MKKVIIFLICFSFSNQVFGSFRVVHYNIRELDTLKIQDGTKNLQLLHAVRILKELRPDILSINELAFDFPGVPDLSHQSYGDNLARFSLLVGIEDGFRFFAPANTGLNAKRLPNGSFAMNPHHPNSSQLVDQVNFGIFPGEYSTGSVIRKFPISNVRSESKMLWRDFHLGFDPSRFKDENGKPYPVTMELLDKNFTDITVTIEGKLVHLIFLHTVPAYNFGNKNGLNVERNGDQLAFLEWYLTGSSPAVAHIGKALPLGHLPAGSSFIAMGDWNTDVTHKTQPGARIVRRLKQKFQMWQDKPEATYESSGFRPGSYRAQFDYILMSRDMRPVDGGVAHPPERRKELGCQLAAIPSVPKGFQLVSFANKKGHASKPMRKRIPTAAKIERFP